jgi:hypothetical protein
LHGSLSEFALTMEHNSRVDEGNKEQDTTTRLELITIISCIQTLLEDSIEKK